MALDHGCRAEYGPLVLRIQVTSTLNGFKPFLEDPREGNRVLYEHKVLSTLESAKEDAVRHADEYLKNATVEGHPTVDWRCS